MLKRLFTFIIPGPIKNAARRKEAKQVLYDLPSYIYAAVDEQMLLHINFPRSDFLLSRAYLILHRLEKNQPEDFYSFVKTEVFDFLVIMHHRLEDHLQGKKPHPLACTYLEIVDRALEKARFVINADTEILPDPGFLFIEYDHYQHS